MPYVPDRSVGPAQQRGFSLIEAMFSALILAIALLGLAGFQVAAMSDASLVKARSVAANLAQEKLDDLRGFTHVADDPSTTTVNECAAPTFCFSEIAQNAGGAEKSGGALVLPSGTVAGYLDSYSIAWTVTCSTETAGSALSFVASCTDAVVKLATVTVSWTDSKGADQFVRLQGVIYAMDPARMAGGLTRSFSNQKPQVSYTPNADSVPIEIGGGKSTETSKPLPEVSGGDSKRVTLPSVVYIGESGSETLVSQEEYATVNCTCTLNSTPASAWTPHRTVWNGSALVQEHGEEVSKVVGQPSASGQDPLCTQCCRDHHDTNLDSDGTFPTYRPYVPSSEFLGSGDHKHYKADGSEAATGEVYVEACRMKRVDGFWRAVADWQLVDLAVFGCDYFVDAATSQCPPTATADPAKQGIFKTWVKSVLQSYVGYLNSNKTASSPLPAFSSGVTPLLDVAVSADDIDLIAGGNKQLIARGIYVDAVFKPKSSGTPRAVDTDYVAAVLPVSSGDFNQLQHLPFYDANLTKLANWSPTSTDTAGSSSAGDCSKASPDYGTVTPTPSSAVCVTSEAIDTINEVTLDYYDDFYSRGKIFGKAASGSTLITASVARGNNGLTSSASITGVSDIVQTRQVKATIPASGTTVGVSGTVIRGNSGVDLSKVTITASPSSGVSCVFTTLDLATASAADYVCTVPSGWSGTLSFGDSDSTANYSYGPLDPTYTLAANATTQAITAPNPAPNLIAYGETASLYGRLYATGQAGNQVSVTATNPTTNVTTTCAINGGVVTCAGLSLTSGTWSGTVTIANQAGKNNGLAEGVTSCNGATTIAKTTGTLVAGPGDLGSATSPTAFTFCAK